MAYSFIVYPSIGNWRPIIYSVTGLTACILFGSEATTEIINP